MFFGCLISVVVSLALKFQIRIFIKMDINRIKYIGLAALAGGGIISLLNHKSTKTVNENDLVVITGCDSGLG